MEIKDIIRNRRLELGMRMEDLAAKIGVTKGTISRWESGQVTTMKQDKIAPLSRALMIDPSCLVEGIAPAEPQTDGQTQTLLQKLFRDDPAILNEIQSLTIEGALRDANGAYTLTEAGEAMIKLAITSAIREAKEKRLKKIETKLKGSDLQ